jgi:hypothetical protein
MITRLSFQYARIFNRKDLSLGLLQVISLAQRSDPLNNVDLPTIDIAIPCHKKDFENLHLVIQGARIGVKNPIGKVVLITPSHLSEELQSKFSDCLVLTDENVLTAAIASEINKLVPKERRGWVAQQIIKFRISLTSNEVATLILDADTILLTPRTWLDREMIQILCIGWSRHLAYKRHYRKVFGGENSLLSFVTHHQLMKRSVVMEIFGRNGEGLLDWIKLADYGEASALSEYDTYGEWLFTNKSSEIKFAKWNNSSIKINSIGTSYSQIINLYGKYHSISNHSYL